MLVMIIFAVEIAYFIVVVLCFIVVYWHNYFKMTLFYIKLII
jgi:hypothetical protein